MIRFGFSVWERHGEAGVDFDVAREQYTKHDRKDAKRTLDEYNRKIGLLEEAYGIENYWGDRPRWTVKPKERPFVYLEPGEVVCRTKPCRCTGKWLGDAVCGTCNGSGLEYDEVSRAI